LYHIDLSYFTTTCSLFSLLLLMGKSKRGSTIVLDLELTMMLLGGGVPQWHTVLMEQGKYFWVNFEFAKLYLYNHI